MPGLIVFVLAFSAALIGGVIGGVHSPADAGEFPASVLESTVSVLPRRTESITESNRPDEPEGTGIAVFDGSYIATAAHVLTGAQQIDVRLNDGRILPARIIGRDGATDIALLGINTPIPPFVLADAPSMGAPVCSIGNQFGLGLSATCGVISAVHRANAGFNPIEDFIQTDAVVNPGASGGALIDGDGRLVGMLSGIFTKDSDANIGVNFAVHAALLERVLDDLKDYGQVRRAKSGMVVQPLEPDERDTQTGVRVFRIAADGAAWRAGLRPDDVIVTMGERKIQYPAEVSSIVYGHRPGDIIVMGIMRDGQDHLINLMLDE